MNTHSSLLVLVFVFAMKGNLQIPSNKPSLHVMLAWNCALAALGVWLFTILQFIGLITMH